LPFSLIKSQRVPVLKVRHFCAILYLEVFLPDFTKNKQTKQANKQKHSYR